MDTFWTGAQLTGRQATPLDKGGGLLVSMLG
jgi:hypothetical protein